MEIPRSVWRGLVKLVSTALCRERAGLLLARIEAMRTIACADEDGVIANEPPPAARVVRR